MSAYRDNPEFVQEHYDSSNRLSGNATPSPHDIPLSPRLGAHPGASESSAALAPYSDTPQRAHYGDRREFQQNDAWVEKPPSKSKKARYFIIGGLVLVILAAIGIALGVTLSKKKSSSSSSSISSSTSSDSSSDPSNFQKDSRLKQSFYGLAYTPPGSQLPDCGNSLDGVIQDIQLISQLTTRIRLYGADCNQTELVLEAIKQTKVNVSVVVANYPIATDGGAAYTRQAQELEAAITAYGTDHMIGMVVGNEFILDYLDDNGGGDDPNSSVGNQGADILTGFINDTKTMLSNMSVSLPVGNADAGSYFNNLILEDVSFGMSNVHPWFANVSVDQAAGWTWDFFETQNVQPASELPNKPTMSIAETGWPSNATDPGSGSNGPSTASEPNLQTFLNDFVCQANANGTEYYFFEVFDEEWKLQQFGGVEGYWGLFYFNKTLKDITIPDCSS
jgi:exo-beta-1,3-glucanase (GH17 family)